MTSRLHGDCSRKPRPRSSGASAPRSGSSPAIFTYPPSGSGAIRYSVSPRWNPKSARAEADREADDLHPEGLRHEEVPELVHEDEPAEQEDDRANLEEEVRHGQW